MKSLLVSALIVGSLACPVVYAAASDTQTAAPAANQAPEQQATDSAKDAKKPAKKHVKKHKHAVKKQKSTHHSHTKPGETPAEKKIDTETELNRR